MGGIQNELKKEDLQNYFQEFPDVEIADIDFKTMVNDQGQTVPKKFSFIDFKSEDAADVICSKFTLLIFELVVI